MTKISYSFILPAPRKEEVVIYRFLMMLVKLFSFIAQSSQSYYRYLMAQIFSQSNNYHWKLISYLMVRLETSFFSFYRIEMLMTSFSTFCRYIYDPQMRNKKSLEHFRQGSICLLTQSHKIRNLLFKVLILILEISYCPSRSKRMNYIPSTIMTFRSLILQMTDFNLETYYQN